MLGNFVTIKEATQKTGVTRQTIYNWINKGDLDYVQLGRSRVVDLENLLEVNRRLQQDPRSSCNRKPNKKKEGK